MIVHLLQVYNWSYNNGQLKENIDSIDISLSKEILKEIEDIHLSDPNPCV